MIKNTKSTDKVMLLLIVITLLGITSIPLIGLVQAFRASILSGFWVVLLYSFIALIFSYRGKIKQFLIKKR